MPENNKPLQVIVEKIHKKAIIPTKGSSDAACFDVYSIHNAKIKAGGITTIATGIKMKIPAGYMIQVVPRSGLAFRHGITVVGGIIDSDYRGEIKVGLTMFSHNIWSYSSFGNLTGSHKLKAGERIAQLQVIPVPQVSMIEGSVDDDTERGAGGFGSTGR